MRPGPRLKWAHSHLFSGPSGPPKRVPLLHCRYQISFDQYQSLKYFTNIFIVFPFSGIFDQNILIYGLVVSMSKSCPSPPMPLQNILWFFPIFEIFYQNIFIDLPHFWNILSKYSNIGPPWANFAPLLHCRYQPHKVHTIRSTVLQ